MSYRRKPLRDSYTLSLGAMPSLGAFAFIPAIADDRVRQKQVSTGSHPRNRTVSKDNGRDVRGGAAPARKCA